MSDTKELLVVSLGSWCGIRGVVREMGLPGANLPFDWLRCSLDGVIHALRTDFQDFLSYDYVVSRYEREQPVARDYLNDSADESILPFKDIYVSWGHSFWHDDLDLQEERQKYQRRIERFRDLRSGSSIQPLLFVRAANSTTELAGIRLLHDLLLKEFGAQAHLLVILNHQPSRCAIFFDDRPTLILQTCGHDHDDEGLHGMKPLYHAAISLGMICALREESAAADGEMQCMQQVRYPSVSALLRNIHCGLFEDIVLADDLSRQWAHIPHSTQIPDSNSLGLFDAVERCLCGADVRRSPYDGKLYEFAGLLRTCTPGWSSQEVEKFWLNECMQLLEDSDAFNAAGISGNPQEATEAAIAQAGSNKPELRRNPYDNKVYDFEHLVHTCTPHWTREEVIDFWDLNCVPLNAWNNSLPNAGCSSECSGGCADALRVISLGAHCGVKHALIRMGLSKETFPFDWLRTSLDSVIRALRTDFECFVDYKQAIPHYDRPRVLHDDEIAEDDHTPFEVVYACDGHAFWHSICWDDRVLASCHRRSQRLLHLRNPSEASVPLLFVRAASTGHELGQLDDLFDTLKSQFGEDVYLLHMLTSQPSYETIFFSHNPHLVVATLGSTYNESEEYMGVIPLYHDAIWDMIWYIQKGQRAKSQVELVCLADIEQHLGSLFDVHVDLGNDTRSRWSPSPLCSPDNVADVISCTLALPRTTNTQIVGNASSGFQRLCPEVGGVRAISLGSWCGVKAAIHEVGFNKVNLPFDWIRCSMDGVIHNLSSDFADFLQCDHVIRRHEQDQHPNCQRFSADAAVPSPPRYEHIFATWGWSFWYDDLTSESERQKYMKRIDRLRHLRATLHGNSATLAPLLFVRAASSSGELRKAGELLKLLEEKFGKVHVNLLMLVNYQPKTCLFFFDDHPSLLLQTFSKNHEDLPGMLPLYADAITRAVGFVLTRKRPAEHEAHASLADFLADTPHYQLGLPVYEDVVLEEDLTRQWSPLPCAETLALECAPVKNNSCALDGRQSRTKWDAGENRMYEIVE